MNNVYFDRAKKTITDPKILSLVISKRAKQLAMGMRPMVRCKSENWLDVALLEVAEGKLSYEFSDTPEEDIFAQAAEDAKAVAAPAPRASRKAAKAVETPVADEAKSESADIFDDVK